MASIIRKFSSRSNTSEEDGLELDDRNVPQNGVARSQQIREDLHAGTALCATCIEPVALGHGTLYNIWSCKECHNCYHYECVKAWEVQSYQNSIAAVLMGDLTWKCPTCSTLQRTIQGGPKCWCGKQDHRLCGIGSPNACGYSCGHTGNCAHGRDNSCSELCHPGPCRIPCAAECPPGPIQPPRTPTSWGRFRERFRKTVRERKNGSLKNMAFVWLALAVMYGLLGVLCYYHIRWNNMPYKYPDLDTNWEITGLVFGLTFIVFPASSFLVVSLFAGTSEFLEALLNFSSATALTGRQLRIFGSLLLAAPFLLLWCMPFIAFFGGPGRDWEYQMKDSCKGLDTRITMDGYPGNPATRFVETNVGRDPKKDGYHWFLGQHTKPTPEPSNETFQFYTRLSGWVENQSVAVDIDIANHSWRFYRLNDTDEVNAWRAYWSKNLEQDSSIPIVPEFNIPTETLLVKGTFSDDQDHIEIPELEIIVRNMRMFLKYSAYEPFLRVFNYRGYNFSKTAKEQGETLPALLWSSKPHDREVMRMAAFGRGRSSLTLCVRDYLGYRDGKALPVDGRGIQESEIVPFAIIAAMRQRYTETRKRARWGIREYV